MKAKLRRFETSTRRLVFEVDLPRDANQAASVLTAWAEALRRPGHDWTPLYIVGEIADDPE